MHERSEGVTRGGNAQELRRENIRQLADAHMESTHGKAPSVASGTYHTQFSSNMNRPVSIPASDVIARQPQSVSNRDLQV